MIMRMNFLFDHENGQWTLYLIMRMIFVFDHDFGLYT